MFIVVVFVLALLTALGIVALSSGWGSFEVWVLLLSGAGIALLCVVLSAFHTGSSDGGGDSVGTIVNVSREGFWWSNPTVYVLHRGEMKADPFAIEDRLVDTAHHYSETGERVRVHYRSSIVCGAWDYSSCDVVDRIDLDDGR